MVTTGDTQGALGEVRLLELVPDLATKCLDKITTRRSFAVSTSAEMRVLAEVMDSLMAGHVGRAGDIMAQWFRALEYVATEGGSWSKAKHLELTPLNGATSLTPGLRGEMNRQARRDQRWIGRPSNWTSREQDQNPSRQGAKGSAKNGTQWKSREGNQFGKGNKKGNKTWESNEQVPGSIEWPDAKRPKRVWGPALSQERGKP